VQLSLFSSGRPRIDPAFVGAGGAALHHVDLGRGAWLERVSGWLHGHETVFRSVRRSARWRSAERKMYDRVVAVPRLMARFPEDGVGHPVLTDIAQALTRRYGYADWSRSAALYRDGRDSVAFHGDRMGAQRANTVVAIVSVGQPRRFMLRPAGGGPSIGFDVGWGDLVVMGGTCQATFEHAIPKAKGAGPRMALMFRPRVGQASHPGAFSR